MREPFWTPLLLLLVAACTTAPPADAPADAGLASGADAGPSADAAADAGRGSSAPTHRAASVPIGIENVNDSPLLDAHYRALLRFVPDRTITIDRMYFGYKLRGAHCWDDGQAGYGAGDGGTLDATLVDIDPATGLPQGELDAESVNGCTRHDQAAAELGGDPVLVWVNLHATLEAGRMYGLVVRNAHDDPARNFFSFNMPLADTSLAGPHARNELDPEAAGAILVLDPREHVAWSQDDGLSWRYGSENGQYASYMNDHDLDHPATRMPQYGFRLTDGTRFAPQPYYAYSDDCVGCTVACAHARVARTFDTLGGFIASGDDVGTLTLTNTDSGAQASCTPARGYGFRTCTLPTPVRVEVGQSYTVHGSGAVEILRLDHPQRVLFPGVGSDDGEWPVYQPVAAPGTNERDVPSLWAGPLSTYFVDLPSGTRRVVFVTPSTAPAEGPPGARNQQGMTNGCENFEVEVGMRQHGALDPARVAALEAHLAGCPACRKFAAETSGQTDALRDGVARDAAAVDWTRIHEGVRRLRRGQQRRLWLAPVLAVLFPLALLVSGGRLHDPKLYAMIPVANFSIYLVYVWLTGRPFREVLAVAHSGAPLLEGYARELRRQRLRTWFFVAWNGSAALLGLGVALAEGAARLRLYGVLLALGFGAWTAYDLAARLPRLRRALAEVAR